LSGETSEEVPSDILNGQMANQNDGSFYIELCKNPIRFDPVDKVTNVFYDDANKQVNREGICNLI
jgi:hypothetical protein